MDVRKIQNDTKKTTKQCVNSDHVFMGALTEA